MSILSALEVTPPHDEKPSLLDALPDIGQDMEGSFLPETGKALGSGTVNTAAAYIKGAAGQRAVIQRDIAQQGVVIEVMKELGLDPGEMFTPEQSKAFASRVKERMAEIPVEDITKSKTYQLGKSMQDWSTETFKSSKDYEHSWTRWFAESLASTVPTIAASLIPGGQMSGPFLSSGETLDRAIKAGATKEQVLEALRYGVMPGMTESLPWHELLEKIPIGRWGKVMGTIIKIGQRALAEGGQEGFTQFVQNVIAKYVYKPDQDVTEGVLQAAGAGAAVGGAVQTAAVPFVGLEEIGTEDQQTPDRQREGGTPVGGDTINREPLTRPAGAPPGAAPAEDVIGAEPEAAPAVTPQRMVVNDPAFTARNGEQFEAGPLHGQTVEVLETDAENMSLVRTPDGQTTAIGNSLLKPLPPQETIQGYTPELMSNLQQLGWRADQVAGKELPELQDIVANQTPPPAPQEAAVAAAAPTQAAEALALPDSPRLTEQDRKSPIPNDVIDAGKSLIEEATGKPSTFTTTQTIDGKTTVVTGNVADLVAGNRAEIAETTAQIMQGVSTPEILAGSLPAAAESAVPGVAATSGPSTAAAPVAPSTGPTATPDLTPPPIEDVSDEAHPRTEDTQTFEEFVAKSQAHFAAREAKAKVIAERGGSTRMEHPTREGQKALVGPDMAEPGKFRVTRFDKDGPFGHTTFNTLQEAANEALRDGYVETATPTVLSEPAKQTALKDKIEAKRGAAAPVQRPRVETRPIKDDVAITATGRDVPVTYAVVEADSLIASQRDEGGANPDYPAELQPRDRSRGTSDQQISSIANNLDPRLLDQNPNASDGAPIISEDGVVESGNGRVLGVRKAYNENLPGAATYRDYLASQGYPVEGMQRPVLVRVRQGQLPTQEREAFTREANERTTLAMTATERAMADSAAMKPETIALYRGGDITDAGNRDFVRSVMGSVSANDRAAMVTPDGTLSQEGIRRVQGALLGKAYGDADLVGSLVESTDSNIKAIGGALMDVSGAWAQVTSEAKDGTISPDADITPHVLEAVRLVQRARSEGRPLAEFVNQKDIFSGETLDPRAEFVLRLMFRNTASWTQPVGREKLAEALRYYAGEMRKTTAGVDLLGEKAPAPTAVLEQAKRRQYGQEETQATLALAGRGNGPDNRAPSQGRAVEAKPGSQPQGRAGAAPEARPEVAPSKFNKPVAAGVSEPPERPVTKWEKAQRKILKKRLSSPEIADAEAAMKAIPRTNEKPGDTRKETDPKTGEEITVNDYHGAYAEEFGAYGSDEWWAKRRYNFKGEKVDMKEAVNRLTAMAKKLATKEINESRDKENDKRKERNKGEGQLPHLPDYDVENGKRAFIIMGPPAAGKSTIANAIAYREKAAISDVDEAKKVIPEYQGGIGANATHVESWHLGIQMTNNLLAEGANLIIPTVGDAHGKIEALRRSLVDRGYRVELVLMDVSPTTAVDRMYGRFLETGRLIPPEYFLDVVWKPPHIFEWAQKEGNFDGYARVYSDNVSTTRVTEASREVSVLAHGEQFVDAGEIRQGGDGSTGSPAERLQEVRAGSSAKGQPKAKLGERVAETRVEPGARINFTVNESFADTAAQWLKTLRKTLDGLGLQGVDLNVWQQILVDQAGETFGAHGMYTPDSLQPVIQLALQSGGAQTNPEKTLWHEAAHALIDLVLNRTEKAILFRTARQKGWATGQIAETYAAQPKATQVEEGIVDAFLRWQDGEKFDGILTKSFKKLSTYLKGLYVSLTAHDIRNADDIFRQMASGKLGKRLTRGTAVETTAREAPESVYSRELPDGRTVTVENPDEETYRATVDGQRVAEMNLTLKRSAPYATSMQTTGPRRQGIMAALHDAAEAKLGRRMIPSPLGLSDEAIAFWKNRLSKMEPEEKQALLAEMVKVGQEAGVSRSSRERADRLGYQEPSKFNKPFTIEGRDYTIKPRPELKRDRLPRATRDMLDAADDALTADAQEAISDFVGHLPRGVVSGTGHMSRLKLEAAIRGNTPLAATIEKAFAPVREKLRELHGDTVKLYRAQRKIVPTSSSPRLKDPRSSLSWTSDYDYAVEHAGTDGMYDIVSAEVALDDVVWATDRAGQAEFIVRNERTGAIDQYGRLGSGQPVAAYVEPAVNANTATKEYLRRGLQRQEANEFWVGAMTGRGTTEAAEQGRQWAKEQTATQSKFSKPTKIEDGKGRLITPPRTFYRGTNTGTRRIKTGAAEWDSYLFAADNEDGAGMYGKTVQRMDATPDAKILYEGTPEWNRIAGKQKQGENLLTYADRAASAIKAAGYDAAWFKRQSDVGTAIFNPERFVRDTGASKFSKPTSEMVDMFEGKREQFTLAGTERTSSAQLAQMKADAPLKASKNQEFDLGELPLFSDQKKQMSLFSKPISLRTPAEKAAIKGRVDAAVKEAYAELHPNPLNPDEVGFANADQTGVVMMQLENYFGDRLHVKWLMAWPQKSGMGTRGMDYLKELATKHDVPLALTPWKHGELGEKKLTAIYKGMGFVPGKGGMMWWHPPAKPSLFMKPPSSETQDSRFMLQQPPHTITQGSQVMQGFIQRGQPVDRAMRVVFDFLGGLDNQNRWKPGKRLSDKMGSSGRQGFGIGSIIGGAVGGFAAGPVGFAAGFAGGGTVGAYILGGKAWPTNGAFGWFGSFAENAKAGLIDGYGQDPEYIETYRQSELGKAAILRKTQGIMKVLSNAGVGTREAEVLQQILSGKAVNDEAMKRLAVPIRQAIDDLGAEAVSLGLISAESFERNRGAYLHRVYQKYETDAKGGLAGWVSDRMASKRKKIIGDSLKGRGMFIDNQPAERIMRDVDSFQSGKRGAPVLGEKFRIIDEVTTIADLQSGEPSEKTLRRVYWPANEAVPAKYQGATWKDKGTWEVRQEGKTPTLWRDYTEDERQSMGEIVDARYTVAKTFMLMANDLSTGRFYRDVAQREEWTVSKPPPDGTWKNADEYSRFWNDPEVRWVKVPDTNISNTGGKKRWGALSGKYVRSEIWRDLNELNIAQNPTVWRRLFRQWKMNKTARHPGVHMNNIISNVAFMDMADVRTQDLIAGIKAFATSDKDYQEAVDNGAFGSDMVSQELRDNVLKPILDEITKQSIGTQNPFMAKFGVAGIVADKLWSWAKFADQKMLDAYGAEDAVFRMATYLRRRSQGESPRVAALNARDQFLNYDIKAPWVVAARNTVLPFIGYSYRGVPKLAENIMHRPWKVAKYATMGYMANALAYMLDDWDDDTEDKDKDGEQRERAALRNEEQGYTWLGTPRMVRMPWRDSHGLPVFLDIRRWIPAGDIYDTTQGSSALPIPAPLQFGGPLSLAFEFNHNKKAFDGKEITNELTQDSAEQASSVADWAWKAWAPGSFWTPNSWYWTKMANAIYGAKDTAGNPYSLPQAALSSIGIKVKPVDVENGIFWHFKDFEKVKNALSMEMGRLSRDLERGLISQKAFDSGAANLVEKYENLGKKVDAYDETTRRKVREPAD